MMVTNRCFFFFSEIESYHVAFHLPWPGSHCLDQPGFKLPASASRVPALKVCPLCIAVFFKCIFVCIRICICVSIQMWVYVGMHMAVKG